MLPKFWNTLKNNQTQCHRFPLFSWHKTYTQRVQAWSNHRWSMIKPSKFWTLRNGQFTGWLTEKKRNYDDTAKWASALYFQALQGFHVVQHTDRGWMGAVMDAWYISGVRNRLNVKKGFKKKVVNKRPLQGLIRAICKNSHPAVSLLMGVSRGHVMAQNGWGYSLSSPPCAWGGDPGAPRDRSVCAYCTEQRNKISSATSPPNQGQILDWLITYLCPLNLADTRQVRPKVAPNQIKLAKHFLHYACSCNWT